jgi:hypothetical protein
MTPARPRVAELGEYVRLIRCNRLVIAFLAFVTMAAGAAVAPAALAQSSPTQSLYTPSALGQRRVCAPHSGWLQCQAIYQLVGAGTNAHAFVPAVSAPIGFGPGSLRSAYNLIHDSDSRGWNSTLAIVDAYRDPDAVTDLARYRSHYGLGKCTKASGCLRIVNQAGRTSHLPAVSEAWAVEESLDLDMTSAICPHCHLLLVEASSPTPASLGRAENTAVRLGANVVSNSWSGTETRGLSAYDHYFNHPGVAIVVASGDSGYGTSYPADLQYVTAVGGTTLTHAKSGSRAWTETVWGDPVKGAEGTGSGCTPGYAKPSWQDEAGDTCLYRTQNDVAAVANPATGVAVYDTYRTGGTWATIGGTSAATPLIAAVYALAGHPAARSYPASYPYQHPGHLHAVTKGANGICPATSSYLCQAERGYCGPTGLGTPLGVAAFQAQGIDPVTLVDPGPQRTATRSYRLTIVGLDTRAKASSLRYSATGLPPGLIVRRAPGSTNGLVSGTISASVAKGTIYHVVITGQDRKTGHSGRTRFTITLT